ERVWFAGVGVEQRGRLVAQPAEVVIARRAHDRLERIGWRELAIPPVRSELPDEPRMVGLPDDDEPFAVLLADDHGSPPRVRRRAYPNRLPRATAGVAVSVTSTADPQGTGARRRSSAHSPSRKPENTRSGWPVMAIIRSMA